MLNHPGAAELILNDLRFRDAYIKEWSEAQYIRSNKYLEDLKYPTLVPDLLVRSKSESDIISRLLHFNIPFRYEEEHIFDGIAFHPDITCLNITTLQEVYIEHLGALDKPDYVEKLSSRGAILAKAGIVPWRNLIITTETADMPLDINWVDELIQYFMM